ncbi:MAG: divalent cation transporter [Halioglobus sp.]|nr:divalent cation transporter [Halioglobus sp.]
MSDWIQIALLTLGAGITMPIGAAIAGVERIHPSWLEAEFRHSVIAFGGGALLAAIALVLVPEGTANLPPFLIVVCFAGGGLPFMFLDRRLAASDTPASQLTAMLSALCTGGTGAWCDLCGVERHGTAAGRHHGPAKSSGGFQRVQGACGIHTLPRRAAGRGVFLMALLGPIAGLAGYLFLSQHLEVVSGIMLFAAGGILYIIFQDIAPQARLENYWAPPLSAVAGFLLGVMGHVAVAA